mmetsp:Transcript_80357/g.204357  ORF Transcript_80357/g.204357 Transcript_80357/m.204357 type:complete len:372 (-) Transcript_80357:496-1611(-)
MEQLLSLALVGDRHLELLVLFFTVLTSTLQLHLHLRDLSLQAVNCLSQGLDGHLQVLDLGDEILLLAVLVLGLQLVGVELVHAEVLVLDLGLLLFEELRDHVVDGFFDTREGVQLDLVGQGGEARAVDLAGDRRQDLRGLCPALRLLGAAGLHECRVEGLGEKIVGIVSGEHGQGLGHGLHLQLPRLLALLPLLVRHLALLLQHHQELLICGKRGLCVLNVHLRLRILLVRVSQLAGLGLDLRLAGRDLLLLRGLQVLVCFLVGHLLLLRGRQIRLEGLLHLPQDAEDLARLRSVGLLEGRPRIEVILGGLHKGGGRLALRARQDTLQEGSVLAEFVLQGRCNAQHVAAGNLQEARSCIVLREHRDRRLER